MQSRLEQVFAQALTLPPDLQNEIAEQLSEDIDSELRWQHSLTEPQPLLNKLAANALNQSAQGNTLKIGFDEI